MTKIQFDLLPSDRTVRTAERRLARADPIMKRLIGRHGRCPLAEREFQPFHILANSIISRQLSTKPAAAIKQKLAESIPPPFAAKLLYGKGRRSKTLLARVAESWRPYRSNASWYLWKLLESD